MYNAVHINVYLVFELLHSFDFMKKKKLPSPIPYILYNYLDTSQVKYFIAHSLSLTGKGTLHSTFLSTKIMLCILKRDEDQFHPSQVCVPTKRALTVDRYHQTFLKSVNARTDGSFTKWRLSTCTYWLYNDGEVPRMHL